MNIQDRIKASEEIQSEIRKQSIMVPNGYIGTINPNLGTVDCGIKVYGDSCGPICPEKYFVPNNYRILYILKETYIRSLEEVECLNEGYDKSSIYRKYEYSDLEITYKNIAKSAYLLLTGSVDFINETAIMDCFRKNVCIVNVNYFPGIAITNGTKDKYIYEWAKINEDLIKRQIDLYEPSIVIGGHTLGHFLNRDSINNGSGKLLGRRMNFLYSTKIKEMFGKNFGNNNDTYYNDNELWINSYHPASAKFADRINLFLKIREYWSHIVSQ